MERFEQLVSALESCAASLLPRRPADRSTWERQQLWRAALGAEPRTPEELLDRALLAWLRGDMPAGVEALRRSGFSWPPLVTK